MKAFFARINFNIIRREVTDVFLFFLSFIKKHKGAIIILSCCFGIVYCFYRFYINNKIPHRTIGIQLDSNGYVDSSYCYVEINVDYKEKKDSLKKYNKIYIKHNNQRKGKFSYTMQEQRKYFLRNPILKKYEDVLNKLPLDSLYSVYTIKYRCGSNAGKIVSVVDGIKRGNGGAFSFVSPIILKGDDMDNYAYGEGFALLPNNSGDIQFSFSTNSDNDYPMIFTPWDISQTNMHLILNTNYIKCEKICIDYNGAVDFSDMFPTPDIINVNSIVFTNPHKIAYIQKEGLKFHADFIELKNIAQLRNYILTAILSITISILCSIVINKN